MSVLCRKDYTINVVAPCVFIQDATSDNLVLAGGCAYSSDRNEVLAGTYGASQAFFLINASTRVGGPKRTPPDFPRCYAWCPTNSKYYIGLFGQSFTAYKPSTNTFDPIVALGANSPDSVVFASSNGKIYFLANDQELWEVNPATNVPTLRFTGAAGDDYGYQIDYSPSLNAIVGVVKFTTNVVAYWTFSLNTLTMSTFPFFGPTAGNANGVSWDATHNSIWISLEVFPNTFIYQMTPPSLVPTSNTTFAGLGSATYLNYDAGSNSVYFAAAGTQKENQFKVSDLTLHTLVDAGFKYANGDASPQVIVSGVFFASARTNPGAVGGVRSCGVNLFP